MGFQNQDCGHQGPSSAIFLKVYFLAPMHINGLFHIVGGQNQAGVTKCHQVQMFKMCIFLSSYAQTGWRRDGVTDANY